MKIGWFKVLNNVFLLFLVEMHQRPLLKFKENYVLLVSSEGEKVERFLQFFVTMTSLVQESNFIGVWCFMNF